MRKKKRKREFVSPDDKMTIPIDNLVFWVCRLISRVHAVSDFTEDEREDLENLERNFFQREEDLRQSYLVVIRLRAKEVVEYAKQNGIRGMTEQHVKDDPFLMVTAIGCKQGLLDDFDQKEP
jgi:hypothetical protein